MSLSVPYCGGCRVHCCGSVDGFRPVLMPWEDEKDYFGLVDRRGKLTLIRQRGCGTCVFYSQNKCGIHERRPFECRVYPFILDLSKGVTLKVDPRASCGRLIPVAKGRELLRLVASKVIPGDWARAYMFFQSGVRLGERKEKASEGASPL